MKMNLTYSLNPKQLPKSYLQVMDCYSIAAKNIYNSALFMVKNIFSSYSWDKELDKYILKDNLHSNQILNLEYSNKAIVEINIENLNNYNKNLEEYNTSIKIYNNLSEKEKLDNKPPKEPKLKKLEEYSASISKKVYYQILDKTVLERAIKVKESLSVYKDYTQISSYVAQSTIHRLCNNFTNYFKVLVVYLANPDSFTGKPAEPNYLNKTQRLTFELDKQRFNKSGKIINILPKHNLFSDFNKKIPLSSEVIKEFNAFNLKKVIEEDIKKRNLPIDTELSLIRVVPGKYKALPRIEYVIHYEKKLEGFYPELEKHYELNNASKKSFYEIKPAKQLEVIKSYFKDKEIPFLASIDCGMTNFATIAYFSQCRAFNNVISGNGLHKRIQTLDFKLDKIKSTLCTEEIRLIQRKEDNKESLTQEERRVRNKFYKELSTNSQLVKLQNQKTNITNDFIHKLSKGILQDLESKGINVLVVGKNLGWKTECNMGRKNNRKFYNFPHARFIEVLKYKAMLKNILVIETEESYTSKTSFIDNEELNTYNIYKEGSDMTTDIKNQLWGRRKGTVFITKFKVKLHADINGAFNIIRKVFNLVYDKSKIRLSYYLNELSLFGKNKFYSLCCGIGFPTSSC